MAWDDLIGSSALWSGAPPALEARVKDQRALGIDHELLKRADIVAQASWRSGWMR